MLLKFEGWEEDVGEVSIGVKFSHNEKTTEEVKCCTLMFLNF